jgi:formiminoglutamase
VVNGRFKGGWTTRQYGRPNEGLHAIQMELAQSTYLVEAAPWTWAHDKADKIRRPLAEILTTLKNWSPA